MNSKFLALASLTLLAILASGCTSQNPTSEKVKVFFEVSADGKTEAKTAEVLEGSNAFDAFKENFQVEFKDSGLGPFITGINGIKADNEHYWALYIDGNYAQKGINQYTISKETNISWKLEKIDLSGFS